MTEQGWSAVCALILANYWDKPWEEPTEALGWDLCKDLDDQIVLAAAVQMMAESDQQYRPPRPAMLHRRAVELTSNPDRAEIDWSQVWYEIDFKARTRGHRPYDENPPPLDWSPAVGPFMDHMGDAAFKELCLTDYENMTTRQAQWRNAWQAWREGEQVAETVRELPATRDLARRRELDPGIRRLAEGKRL